MPSQRQRRRVFYGAFASVFFLAAVGLLYLVWMTVRGIPLDEAERFGRQQTRTLRLATGRFLDKVDRIARVHRDLIATLPRMESRALLDPTDPADPTVNIALSRLEELVGQVHLSSTRIYRVPETGPIINLFPQRASPQIRFDEALRKRILESVRSLDETQFPPLEVFEAKGRVSFLFAAPIRANGKFEGALCLEAPVIPLLAENLLPLAPLAQQSTYFLIEWPENARAGIPKILWNSAESADEPGSERRKLWEREFQRRLAANAADLRDDPSGRGFFLTLPNANEGERPEVVSHYPVMLRWDVFMTTPYEKIYENASSQRLMLITLGSVALGILGTAVVFFVVQIVQRERELKAVEASYQGLFAENPTAMLVLDEQGRILDCNISALRLLGLSEWDAKGKALTDVFDPASVGPLWTALAEHGNLHAVDVRFKRVEDGAETHAEVWGRRIGDRWMLMAHDVGERREFERQMARLKRMDSMGALASTLAHDFNNLLGQIQIMVSNIRADLPHNSTAASDLLAVEGKVDDASQLVAGILAFRENVVSPDPVHLETVLRDFAAAQRRVVPDGVQFAFSIDSDLPSVWVAPTALRRILDNLCKNACDAMPDGGHLSIRCHRRELAAPDPKHGLGPGVYAVIEVGDTGLGISEQALEKLFQPLFTTKSGGRGTGLGLWTVYKILRQLGGGILVHSRYGHGTRFEVFLPHHPPSAENSWIRKEKFEI